MIPVLHVLYMYKNIVYRYIILYLYTTVVIRCSGIIDELAISDVIIIVIPD